MCFAFHSGIHQCFMWLHFESLESGNCTLWSTEARLALHKSTSASAVVLFLGTAALWTFICDIDVVELWCLQCKHLQVASVITRKQQKCTWTNLKSDPATVITLTHDWAFSILSCHVHLTLICITFQSDSASHCVQWNTAVYSFSKWNWMGFV